MAEHFTHDELTRIATVTGALARTRVERSFDLPTGLYVATVALYLAFIGVMAGAFLNPELVIPMVVIAGFIVFAFALAARWTQMQPDNDAAPLTWGQLSHRGIQTLSGPLTGSQAAVQVLLLPVLILGWGIAVAVIVALT